MGQLRSAWVFLRQGLELGAVLEHVRSFTHEDAWRKGRGGQKICAWQRLDNPGGLKIAACDLARRYVQID